MIGKCILLLPIFYSLLPYLPPRGDKRGPSFLTERQYLVDELTRLWLARHVQNLSRISPMRRIFSFTDFYCVLLDLYAPAGRYDYHGLSLAGGYPAPYRRKYNP